MSPSARRASVDGLVALNRLYWDDLAALHATDPSGFYRIDEVIAGGSSLHELEATEIGDLAGRDVVHLQCHIGLDTISLLRHGARRATGLDFSPNAIAAARRLAERAGAAVRFVEAPLTDAARALGTTYDMAFVTWGALCWLPDIAEWGRIVATSLHPGGTLYLADAHPFMAMLESEDGKLVVCCDWRTPTRQPLAFDQATTYTGDPRPLTHTKCNEWIHPIGDILAALAAAGMRLDWFHEHEMVPWRALPDMIDVGDDLFALGAGTPRIPLAFSLAATRL